MSQSAVWGGITDVSGDPTLGQAKLDVVVQAGGGCSGTLISPLAVLTAAHCTNGQLVNVQWMVNVGYDSKNLKAVRTSTPKCLNCTGHIIPFDPQHPWNPDNAWKDVSLIFLDTPVLEEAVIPGVGKNFAAPYNSMVIAGWSPYNRDFTINPMYDRYRQSKSFVSLIANTDLSNFASGNGFVWRHTFNYGAGTQHGDSGGPLAFSLPSNDPDLNGARVVVGVASAGDADVNPTYGEYADITRGPVAAWLNATMLDTAHGGGAVHKTNWHPQHGTDASTYWFGAVDYTGPCKDGSNKLNCLAGKNGGTDCDCDHWYDHGSVIHDDCPLIYNPSQNDADDDGKGDVCQTDADGDGVDDIADNCPSLPSGTQSDANFWAECAKAELASSIAATTGVPCHTPTKNDSQAYAAEWHNWFIGDSCDTDATTNALTFGAGNDETDTCLVLHKSGLPPITYEGTCPAALNTGLQFDSNIGNALGNAPKAKGTSAPAFCRCDVATDGDPLVVRKCRLPTETNLQCFYADDSKWVDLTQPPSPNPPRGWKRITRWGGSNNVYYTEHSTTHYQRSADPFLFDFDSVGSVWNFRQDVTTFGLPANEFSMTGVIWTHVVSFTPTTIGGFPPEGQPRLDYPNHYLPITAARTNSIRLANEWALVSLAFDYDPIDLSFDTALPSPIGFTGFDNGLSIPLSWSANGLLDLTPRFDGAALAQASAIGAGQADFLSDATFVRPYVGGGRYAVVLDSGTAAIRAALSVGTNGNVFAEMTTQTASFGPAAARAFAASTDTLYSIQQGGGYSLLAQDLESAVQGSPATSSVPLTGTPLGTLAALTWSPTQRALYALDKVPEPPDQTRLRLLRIEPSGLVVQMWATKPVSTVPHVYLHAMREDGLVFADSDASSYDVAILDPRGKPLYSTAGASALRFAPFATAAILGIPLAQPFSQGTWDVNMVKVSKSQLTPGLCGSSWLKANGDALGQTPPVVTLAAPDPGCLWPPNHTLVLYELGTHLPLSVADACDPSPTTTLVNVTSNQPGGKDPDIVFGAHAVCLRAERDGSSIVDREYRITVAVSDAFGNATTRDFVVQVPHDQGGGASCANVDTSRIVGAGDARCTR